MWHLSRSRRKVSASFSLPLPTTTSPVIHLFLLVIFSSAPHTADRDRRCSSSLYTVVNCKHVGDPELLGREALLHVAGRQLRRAGVFSSLPPHDDPIPPPPRGVFVFQLADSYQGRRFYATKERVAKFEGVKNSDVSIPRPRRSRSPHRPPRNERKLTVRRVTTPSA